MHPFTGGSHPTDVRITTRYSSDNWLQGIAGTVHEVSEGEGERGEGGRERGEGERSGREERERGEGERRGREEWEC